ncbi:unnamed protein product [Symbiodinium natans]|uniref:Uncharacterized protein n=1 Tax=Symbiodinium natans TaxID=878477 RepID=A0A812V6G4_9DINO|nr:unnamed protein product [Symbiodinium natans]
MAKERSGQCGDAVLCTSLLLEINVLTVVVVVPVPARLPAANSAFNMLPLPATCVRVALGACTASAVEMCNLCPRINMYQLAKQAETQAVVMPLSSPSRRRRLDLCCLRACPMQTKDYVHRARVDRTNSSFVPGSSSHCWQTLASDSPLAGLQTRGTGGARGARGRELAESLPQQRA